MWLLHWVRPSTSRSRTQSQSAFILDKRRVSLALWFGWGENKTLKQACRLDIHRRQLRSKIWWLTVLQFALLIALRCVLHRYGNQDIHRWKFGFVMSLVRLLCVISLLMLQQRAASRGALMLQLKARLSCVGLVLMILPQVHLRKPCYDFSFL